MILSRTAGAVLVAGLSLLVLPAVPATADTAGNVENFLTTLDGLGITGMDPGEAVAVGQSLCPLLAERGQNTANIAGTVSDVIGRPLGPSTAFTGAAISFLCPKALENVTDKLGNGAPLLPLFG
ncbi:MAG: DUF732 domain-containing protein [Mycobacterium sp.]|nr:DUF732 domain-containing protein [Mycobacterium sp.]